MKKHDLPAMPFYWGDWFKALDVQMLPRDIRCTWFEMLGRMWESNPRGELSINGICPTDEQLAMLLGFGNDLNEFKRHIEFLERFSLFSRKKNGVIYSRKMVKMEEISSKRSTSGRLGMMSRYNKTDNKSITNTEYENENESESKDGIIIKPSTKKKFDFEPIWQQHPKKIGKKLAFGFFQMSVNTDEDYANIQKAIDNYNKSKSVRTGYIKNGGNWFNEWEDWVDMPESEKFCEKCKGTGKFTSNTGYECLCDCPAGKNLKT